MPAKPSLPDTPVFDPSSIDFPTDRITIGQMRKAEPNGWRDAGGKRAGAEGLNIYALELRVAEDFFATALGLPSPESSLSLSDDESLVECFNDAYVKYGISSGMEKTKQILRDFEAAVKKQAEQHLGTRR